MSEYTTGTATWRELPRVRTKPSTVYSDGRRDSGGGYERIRSYEHRPHTPRQGKEDVYLSHHRLLAIVACYPEEMDTAEILDHLADKDVHHKSGVEWDNRPGNLAVREHGRHAEITQSQMRAWAEDAKQSAEADSPTDAGMNECPRCGCLPDVTATVGNDEGYCLECAKQRAKATGETVEL